MEIKKIFENAVPGDRLYSDYLRRFAWGTDASFYRLTPELVVRTKSEDEVSAVLMAAHANRIPVTFRAAGTSLSGQGVSDSVLLVAGKEWEGYSIGPEAQTITMQPGLIGAKVNSLLAPHGRKFGPDPASIGSCMVGGIVANNASGMSCGTHANSDKTLVSARIVFPDGSVLDSSDRQSRDAFALNHPEIIEGIRSLREEILADTALTQRILHKYSIKNVTGLNIRPLVAYEDPFEIIAHLMVGSEGTLGFLSEVTMQTLPLAGFSASAMIYFDSIVDAAKAVVAMRGLPVCAAELLDKRSLTAVGDNTADTAVLTQTEAATEAGLQANIEAIKEALSGFSTATGVHFTSEKSEVSRYWAIRSGIFPMVGGMRKEGTTCLIEDVAFHIEDLPAATADLSELLDAHGYDDSCIYGHALEGNFHFIINQSFDTPADVRRYEEMIRDVADLVVRKYDGSLKAEHGTGRNMAPFVEMEWGSRAYSIMRRIKQLFDPKGILNPGVIFNDDPDCFIKGLKPTAALNPSDGAPQMSAEAFRHINKCIECGFCEANCVSCGFTLSSRTRIAVQREIARIRAAGGDPSGLEKEYAYPGEKTCAGDGLCSTSCPMGINVADLTHELRRAGIGGVSRAAWSFAAGHYHATKQGLRLVLGAAAAGRSVVGDKAMASIGQALHKGMGLPLWTPSTPLPHGCRVRQGGGSGLKDKVVYFPSCLNQMMGKSKNSPVSRPLAEETVALLEKAGYEVIFPDNMDSLCCGMLWESKGMPDIADRKVRELEEALRRTSCEGLYPILCDQSPCLHRMRTCIKGLHLYEPAEFIWTFLRDRLVFRNTSEPVAIHQTCTMRLMGLGDTLLNLARLCSDKVLVPEGVGCCGFAGDKGMTNPELNAYALRKLRTQIEEAGIKVGYSNSRTCEIGLETNSGIPYISIVYLVNACTYKSWQ